jgi:hypothetical protein
MSAAQTRGNDYICGREWRWGSHDSPLTGDAWVRNRRGNCVVLIKQETEPSVARRRHASCVFVRVCVRCHLC